MRAVLADTGSLYAALVLDGYERAREDSIQNDFAGVVERFGPRS